LNNCLEYNGAAPIQKDGGELMAGSSQTTDFLSHWCSVCGEQVAVGLATPNGNATCVNCGRLVWLRIQEFSDTVIIHVLPGVDPETPDIHRVGESLLQSRSASKIIVNLACLEWIGSAFLNELLQLRTIVHAANRKLTLCELQPLVQEVFQVSKLDSLFEFT